MDEVIHHVAPASTANPIARHADPTTGARSCIHGAATARMAPRASSHALENGL